MSDLTILYVTANEMPQKWMDYQIATLLTAVGDNPIISLSRIPMDLGENVLDLEPEKSYWNIYRQMLRGARLATTQFVAMVEDDTLYSKEHFTQFRPKVNQVSYNRSRWSLFSWDPIFCLRQRISNCTLIAPREYLIDALEEREKKYPNGHDFAGEVGRPIVERRLRLTPRNLKEWYSTVPVIQLNHPDGIDDTQQRKWKRHGQIKAFDIPFWGQSKEIARIYHESRADTSSHTRHLQNEQAQSTHG